jgi:iron complex transport system substrate-binding protein
MKRKGLLPWGLFLSLTLLIAGCVPAATPAASPQTPTPGAALAQSTPTPSTEAASYPITITDDVGRQVTVARKPERIISLAPSNTEILFALGLGDRVVGVTKYADYPEEAKSKPKIGGFSTVNLELVVAATPDLILATGLHAKKVVPELESKGLTVVVLNPSTMDDVLENISLVGRLTGQVWEADALRTRMEAKIKEVEARLAKAKTSPRVFWEASREFYTAGPTSYIGDIIARAGGTNIATDTRTQWPRLSQEAIIASDPEVILLADHEAGVTPQEVAQRPGWQNITAVKKGRIVSMDSNLISRAGPRVVQGFEEVARAIHPEVFP